MNQLTEDRNLFWLLFGTCCTVCMMVLSAAIPSCGATEQQWTGVVVHHTTSPCWTTAADVDRWHKERGWDGIGYHFLIGCDGTIEEGRGLDRIGAHAYGRNRTHIGIALVGYDTFSPEQQEALWMLLGQLANRYTIRHVERHHEQCPGPGIEL